MNKLSLANALSVSVRVYRALLVAYPKKFREHYDTQMVQVFRDSFRDAYHHNGMSGVIGLWLHTFGDLVFTALMERISERRQYMFPPKLLFLCGMASLLSGLFWLFSPASTLGPLPLKLALVLQLGGLIGLRIRQAGQGGKLGWVGVALAIIGMVLALAYLSQEPVSAIFPYMEDSALASGVLILSLALFIQGFGLALLGVASLRAKNPHPWRGLPLGLGALSAISGAQFWFVVYLPLSQGQFPWNSGSFLFYPIVLWLLGLGWLGLGIMLATEANAQVAEPPPASA